MYMATHAATRIISQLLLRKYIKELLDHYNVLAMVTWTSVKGDKGAAHQEGLQVTWGQLHRFSEFLKGASTTSV